MGKAWKALQSHNIHQAPVLNEAAQLVGMVGDVMRTPVITAVAVTDIRRIAAAVLTHRIDGVPVTGEQGRLVGYLSRSDILRAVVSDPPLSLWR